MIDFDPAVQPVLEVINAMLWPLIAVIGSIGTIYCVFLGVKYSKADTPQDREQAKKHLIGAIVGFLIIILESFIPPLPLGVFVALNCNAFGIIWLYCPFLLCIFKLILAYFCLYCFNCSCI